ncbi:sulfotransferase family protein [Streptomyces sp. NPDC014894]|uniref:sulfotransferase-like domain-containing protein n=1 Tax=Streptomyces sp. NPDC014894 TaxID=3364931 RepID=UPI0036FE97C1
MSDPRQSPRIVALWSAPRSRSTAFFRMMSERGDFATTHEPFSYLAEFGFTDVDGVRATDEKQLLAVLRESAEERPLFFKDTTDERYPGVLADEEFLARDARHVFLIRHPRETIASYYAINAEVKSHQIGFEAQHELFEAVQRRTGEPPMVIDADDLMADAEGIVRAFCADTGIDYRPEALTWQPQSRSEWQPSERWHRDASASSGFQAPKKDDYADVEAHPVLSGYLAHHLPFFSELHARRVRP